jgi:hypothetical protein
MKGGIHLYSFKHILWCFPIHPAGRIGKHQFLLGSLCNDRTQMNVNIRRVGHRCGVEKVQRFMFLRSAPGTSMELL